ncbi:MAG: hypothetical protein JOZ71_06710 [Ktedonobacteraceae bacterium]|nr:hypothetical protein [Ktedonobacteraceae bacterium]
MKPRDHLQTMALTYQEICQGEQPWVALGNFMNDWFCYKKDRRTELVATPLSLPETLSDETFRWAVFCAASVEYLCERYEVPCPSWVHNPAYHLPEPWFDSPMAHKPEVREWLIETTPEPFTKCNIYCGNRMFANKYELAEQYRRRSTR